MEIESDGESESDRLDEFEVALVVDDDADGVGVRVPCVVVILSECVCETDPDDEFDLLRRSGVDVITIDSDRVAEPEPEAVTVELLLCGCV
jgi:hypothetical protein